MKTKETEDFVQLPPNLPPNELNPIHDYVKSVRTAATFCLVSDQLLLTLYREVKFKSGSPDTNSLPLFDYVNEVLLEVYCHHATKLGAFLAYESVSHEAMWCVDWDLILQNISQTREQIMKRTCGSSGLGLK